MRSAELPPEVHATARRDLIERWRGWVLGYLDALARDDASAADRARRHLNDLGLVLYRKPGTLPSARPVAHPDFAKQPA